MTADDISQPIGEAPTGPGTVNPAAMTVEELARLVGLPAERVRRQVKSGRLADNEGRVNLLRYAAWLLAELARLEGR